MPTVLCADDDRNLCEILERALGGEGYRVVMAHDGEQALRCYESERPDLLLLDVLLPRRDGFAVLEQVREREIGSARATPAVLFSGCTSTPGYAERARRLGAGALLTKPVPLAVLVGEVGRQIGGGPTSGAAVGGGRRSARVAPPAGVGEAGDLAEDPIAAVLGRLHRRRAHGTLRVTLGRKKKTLELRGGRPVAVRSNLVNECLGNHLVRCGRITQSAMLDSLRRVRAGEGRQGEVLVAMRLLSPDERDRALREQAADKFFQLFEWREGRYEFRPGSRLHGGTALSFGEEPPELILRGVRTRCPLGDVDDWIARHADLRPVAAPGAEARMCQLGVPAEDRARLAGLDGARRLGEFADAEGGIRRTLFALAAMGVVELRPAAAGPEPTPPQADRARSPGEAEVVPRTTAPEPRPADEGPSARAGTEVPGTQGGPVRGASLGSLLARQEELEQALPEVDEASLPHSLRARRRLDEGRALLERRELPLAVERFAEAAKLDPDEADHHAYLGWALHLARPGDPEARNRAIRHLKRAIRLAPDREKPYLFLARLCRATGREHDAERLLARVLLTQPGCLEARRELRLLRRRRERERGFLGRLLRR